MKKVAIVLICLAAALLLFVIINVLIVRYSGKPVPVPDISREPQTFGEGPQLTYVVMGDSTGVAQGAEYSEGYAVASAKHLAQTHTVTFVNTAQSGAVAKDVANKQAAHAASHRPDIVLIAVGANDVTHLTRGATIERSMQQTIDQLKAANPTVRIVVTGAPAMDTVTRFPWTVQRLARMRVDQVNRVFDRLAASNDLTFAPIAEQTRTAFEADPTLFAADKFHPNARGYALWTPVIIRALDEALR